ncbi:MAG: hypothetical protein WC738_03655 [Candidatus Omnitrophota bacterium]|jgi:hypothetical protein
MRYKTTIQITTEAVDKNEALEIVDEYLSGNLVSGIDMKCRTKPTINHKAIIVGAAAICLVFAGGLLLSVNGRHNPAGSMLCGQGLSAIQPPLKTSSSDTNDVRFKKEWQDKQSHRILDYIKR